MLTIATAAAEVSASTDYWDYVLVAIGGAIMFGLVGSVIGERRGHFTAGLLLGFFLGVIGLLIVWLMFKPDEVEHGRSVATS